ncbi:MAG TPA: helix-turn-helix transcriptional regulator [Streptosporangiaceae bacterium]|nr:helix-turn-helix transcriptional regulator [Streptosporangiaceae bacterium]
MAQQQLDQRYRFGDLLRRWRQERGVSQLALASDADVSPRHLSFVETGRSAPSRGLVLRLAEHLEIPLRGRNELLLAAGFAPEYSQSDLDAPALSMVRVAIRQLLTGHNPYPALAVDRHWNLVEANAAADVLIEDVPDELAAPPFNVLRYSLHPAGLAPRIVNLEQWREHVLGRLDREVRATADAGLAELQRELREYPGGSPAGRGGSAGAAEVVVPLRLLHKDQELSLFSTTTLFGTPNDVTVEELAIESFYPADERTAEYLRSVAP